MKSLPKRARFAFSLVETVVALAMCGFSVSAFYAATGQAMHIAKGAREVVCGSEILQQRIEGFRKASPWSNLTTPAAFSNLVAGTTAMNTNLPGASETYIVSDYPADGNSFTVTRSASGALSTTGSALPSSQTSVLVACTVTWTSWARTTHTRTIRTIISQGGLAP